MDRQQETTCVQVGNEMGYRMKSVFYSNFRACIIRYIVCFANNQCIYRCEFANF